MSLQDRAEHINEAVNKLDEDRNKILSERQLIGHVTHRKSNMETRITARRVNFRWQRGIKIGMYYFGR